MGQPFSLDWITHFGSEMWTTVEDEVIQLPPQSIQLPTLQLDFPPQTCPEDPFIATLAPTSSRPREAAQPKMRRRKRAHELVHPSESIDIVQNSNRLRRPKNDQEPKREAFASDEEHQAAFAQWRLRREKNNEKSRKSRMERKQREKTQSEELRSLMDELRSLKAQLMGIGHATTRNNDPDGVSPALIAV
jgi:hypothetical protein